MKFMRLNIFLLLGLFLLFSAKQVSAATAEYCSDRYLTLVNPVRGRELWADKSFKPIRDQYNLIKTNNFPATWLLQYGVLKDGELVEEIKRFDNKQELGVFLEVSPILAFDSRVIYPHAVAWDDPNAVFLSGYQPSERRKLINRLFNEFKKQFGFYPKSVGAWWIDSYSLDYMVKNYGIKIAMIVADQKTTDDYGVWGQWWGIPYYPHKANVLTPAGDNNQQLDVVVIQWAQRDLTKAYGEGPAFSNYSLQANDYLERGLDSSYFERLTSQYLDCNLPIGQITVGLETGMESVKFLPEYRRQLDALKGMKNLQAITMSEFADRFRLLNKNNPSEMALKDGQSQWVLTTQKRTNRFLGDEIIYQGNLAFADYFVADKEKFLDRRLPINHSRANDLNFPIFPLLAFMVSFLIFARLHILKYFLPTSLFVFASYLTTLKDYSKYGWHVYFGPAVDSIPAVQVLVVLISMLAFGLGLRLWGKRMRNTALFVLLLPLSFAVDFLVGILRYTSIEGRHYFGFAWDALRFVGVGLKAFNIRIINQDFASPQAAALLRFDFDRIWNSQLLSLVVYPLSHIVLVGVIWFVFDRLPLRPRKITFVSLSILFVLYIVSVFKSDPRMVIP